MKCMFEIPDNNVKQGIDYTLMYNKIQKIEVLEKNKARTTRSYILGGIAIAAPFLAIIILSVTNPVPDFSCLAC